MINVNPLDHGWRSGPSGLLLPPKPTTPKRPRPVGIDLFCGCGGFSCGMFQGGFDVVAACDNDPYAALTYLCNLGAYPIDLRFLTPDDRSRFERALEAQFKRDGWICKDGQFIGRTDGALVDSLGRGPQLSGSNRINVLGPDRPGVGVFFFGDVRLLTGDMILDAIGMDRGEVDIVFGGPPCQGFSTSGKRDIMDPRNSLVFEFTRLVLEINPVTLCMENVPGIVNMVTPEGLPVLEAMCRALADGGFGTIDTLKRMIATTSGAGFAMRTRKPGKADSNDLDDIEDPRVAEDEATGRIHPLVQRALFPLGEEVPA